VDTTRPSLLLRIRDPSDVEAWRTFDAVYRPMLRRFARAWGLSEDDADDVAQHCLTALYDRIRDFRYDRGKGRFKRWLRTLVNNRVRDQLRHRRPLQADTAVLSGPQQREQSPEEVFDRIWMEEHLAHGLRELRDEVEEKTFAAFVAHVIEQRPVSEVCERFNLRPNNLYTIKWRLTERLAEKVRELADGLG